MRKPLLAGNWKMNKTIDESVALVSELAEKVKGVDDREILVCPTYPALKPVADAIAGTNIMLGAQNIFWEEKGAYTGEVSGPMLKAAGCKYVIIGHSERRQYFGETDETVNKRVKAALKYRLLPIICVGETLEEREKDVTKKVVETQLKGGINGLTTDELLLTTIAYEPVWAIGTGKTASPEQAEEVHAFIRGLLPAEVKDTVRILYGGSMNPGNVKELMAKEDIDGGLIGGASLKAEDFAAIVKY
ncbi:triose-phosphate isomerase [candidate division WOR-1 bacterium RIFOXYA12_FULL_43_27]|uniref:Triosephosphate isomerase n=1 Tax=candidate division WOR-1 bacterium RIFOXYC2_FULL_46_14 TaxID=1802587 RepID=A0A1F4U865_UNCSA|nr:MAG: triose-phosphate isomerase [candidate division WOR-1 bacterium RIFOXYA12_FULL_43_27]OGC20021.1 MAG: triose-phosphate isomerase [candidate division WOR-1 bacterium RIFOXYB2_FULL_46_45]OGC32242.1 MAG: triose-phosphate isomerase [candidate division WOR-1 bacterium RIFOXYA2_FULL_46_56]OGC41146.1 MAG: triose-phosphate isomerase [candidate division WOR-1 bacterium RIFOXYC2_FULL_46_14]